MIRMYFNLLQNNSTELISIKQMNDKCKMADFHWLPLTI